MAWQPMATAPKDGTRILASICWSFGQDDVRIVRWAVPEPFDETEQWTTDSEGPGYSTGFDESEVRGWMPLPEPINATATST